MAKVSGQQKGLLSAKAGGTKEAHWGNSSPDYQLGQ